MMALFMSPERNFIFFDSVEKVRDHDVFELTATSKDPISAALAEVPQ